MQGSSCRARKFETTMQPGGRCIIISCLALSSASQQTPQVTQKLSPLKRFAAEPQVTKSKRLLLLTFGRDSKSFRNGGGQRNARNSQMGLSRLSHGAMLDHWWGHGYHRRPRHRLAPGDVAGHGYHSGLGIIRSLLKVLAYRGRTFAAFA